MISRGDYRIFIYLNTQIEQSPSGGAQIQYFHPSWCPCWAWGFGQQCSAIIVYIEIIKSNENEF
jgi:hypothetical protein